MKKRIGIFGGTFSPPHVGHVQAAEFFLKEMQLDELWVMPTFIPPHKREMTIDCPEFRLAMTHAAFDDVSPRIKVSDYEIKKADVSYTAETLRAMRQKEPEAELFFLCGTDMFLSLDTWYHPEIIFSLATVVCALRYEKTEDEFAVKKAQASFWERYGAKTYVLNERPRNISSTEIRSMLESGADLSSLVSPRVLTILQEKRKNDQNH